MHYENTRRSNDVDVPLESFYKSASQCLQTQFLISGMRINTVMNDVHTYIVIS